MRYLKLLTILLLSGCANNNVKDTYLYTNIDSVHIREQLSDTIVTPLKREICFKVFNGKFTIHYKVNDKYYTYPDSINLFSAKHYRVSDENEEYILLTGSCGSPCHVSYLLPINKKKDAAVFYEVIFSDLSKNYIVRSWDSLEVYNVKSKKTFKINIDNCDCAFLGYCIDSISINNDTLYYSYSKFALAKGGKKIKLPV